MTSAARAGFQLIWRIKASPAAVFRAWTDPAQLGWYFNDAMPIPDEPIEVDLRVGGVWRQMMVINEERRFFTGGVYKEIEPGKRLVFWWGADGGWPEMDPARPEDCPLVTVTLTARDGGTDLVLDVDLPPNIAEAAARDAMHAAIKSGWTNTVDRLVKRLG
jgi:uncharacterized protein YndB with AHSA1/START domain